MQIIITAGGTAEKIDDVRKITNSSTGKLGIEIFNQLKEENEISKIYYITSKHCLKPELNYKTELITVDSAEKVLSTMKDLLINEKINYVIHSMAVSDYKTKNIIDTEKMADFISKCIIEQNMSQEEISNLIKNSLINNEFSIDRTKKVSSDKENVLIGLEKNPKIINLIKEISPETNLIGFKLLSDVKNIELVEAANKVIKNSGADFVIANDLKNIKNGEHIAYVIPKNENGLLTNENKYIIEDKEYQRLNSKEEIAVFIKNLIRKHP